MSSVYHHDDADPTPYPEKKVLLEERLHEKEMKWNEVAGDENIPRQDMLWSLLAWNEAELTKHLAKANTDQAQPQCW